ncbi:hypothetical protein SY88_05610 [Clostridiales bacterium PH28_bin88]|nr:hypothetical protein SY88_05610 [Clostridiales bacterium PH28_bin88]
MSGPYTKLEELIRESLAEEASQVLPPSPEEVWPKIAAGLEGKKYGLISGLPGRHWFSPQVAVIALLLLAVGIASFSTMPSAGAFNRRLFSVVVDLLTGGNEMTYGDVSISRSNKTPPPPDAPPPPPDWPLATGERVVTVEDARAAAAFPFKQPVYLPKGMALDVITVVSPERINQYFRTPQNRLIIRQQYIAGDFASGSFFSNARVKKVKISEVEGTLVVQRNPYTGRDQVSVMWFDNSIDFRLEGDISEKEALKVANSLK